MHERAGVAVPFSEYLAVLRRRARTVAITAAVVTAFAVAVASRADPGWTAVASASFSTETVASVMGDRPSKSGRDAAAIGRTQERVARTPRIAAAAVRRAGLAGVSTAELLAASSVRLERGTTILRFTVEQPTPRAAVRLADAYRDAYLADRVARARLVVDRAMDDLGHRAARATADGAPAGAQRADLRWLSLRLQAYLVDFDAVADAERASSQDPLTGIYVALVIAVGLVAGALLAFAREALDDRARDGGEVARTLDAPLVGVVRTPRAGGARDTRLAAFVDPRGRDAEAFRVLTANLELVAPDARVLLVTGLAHEAGATATAGEVAVAMARDGRRVAAVDVDARGRGLSRLFGLDTHVGLADAFAGHSPTEAAAHVIAMSPGAAMRGSLLVVPAGQRPNQPLDRERLAAFLDLLRARVDVVVLDAPPILDTSEARRLCALADAVVVVARLGTVRRRTLESAREVVAAMGCRTLAVVVDGVRRERRRALATGDAHERADEGAGHAVVSAGTHG